MSKSIKYPKGISGPPYESTVLDFLQATVSPTGVYNLDNWTFAYFVDKLYQRMVGQFVIEGAPAAWDMDYIKAALFGGGRLAIFRDPALGLLAQYFQWGSGLDVWYKPVEVIVTNPALGSSRTFTRWQDCAILHIDPLYMGGISIVWHYAESLALTWEAAVMNTQNSKLAYLLLSDKKAMTKALQSVFDKVMSGQPAVAIEDLGGKMGSLKDHIMTFSQDLRANYIAPELMRNFRAIMNAFDAEIGIPFANSEKRERLTTDEVNVYNVESQALVNLWLENVNRDAKRAKKLFPDLDLKVSLRMSPERKEADNGIDNDVPGPSGLGS